MQNQEKKCKGRARPRGLPFFDLRKTVERARKLFNAHGEETVSDDLAAIAIGYRDAHGGMASSMLNTMASYGLVTMVRRKVTISPGMAEFMRNPHASKKVLAKAWLANPDMFRVLLDRLGPYGPPSKECVSRALIRKEKLMPRTADRLAEIVMNSFAYANSLPDAVITKSEPQPAGMKLPTDTFLVKLDAGRRAWVTLPPGKLTDTDRDRILQVLELWVDH